ncbi:hypothetical protein BCR43DRAFT_496536 [Syncephalastrum racemosum]|uniref:F-box domain-containing protein n=1 Tax=Syncephalastrum racemosum TaxID=13706 RepID=A0A1X2H4D1_SYNRA|nr:hypothetical protein BCR43DRAFT_496536 [Syncephalastrum racemosum]
MDLARRLPLELVLAILSELPVPELARLHGDPYVDRLLLNHPWFNERRLYICLTTGNHFTLQPYFAPGRILPVPQLNVLDTVATPHCYLSACVPFQVSRFHHDQHQIEFSPQYKPLLSVKRARAHFGGFFGLAVLLTDKRHTIIKRSLHAVKPSVTPEFSREGFFGGSVCFSQAGDDISLSRCTVKIDWFCT